MAIIVGINEDVTLQKVELTEKDGKYSLDFNFGDGGDATISDNPFDEVLDENGMVVVNSSTNNVKLWPIKPYENDVQGNPLSPKAKYDQVYKEINEQKNLMLQCASCFVTSDKLMKEVDGKRVSIIDPYRGLGLTRENMESMLPNEDILQRVFKNMGEDFQAFMNGVIAEEMTKPVDSRTKLRVLLIRQSAAKHYATFRKKFIREQPVFENAAVPKASSKLKFADYEIQKGLNDGTPVRQEAADTTPATDLNEANVFGG